MTLQETVDALRIARAAREYVLRSEEMAKLLVESEAPLDPKIELRTSEAWGRLLEAVKAPNGPPGKNGPAREESWRKKKEGAPARSQARRFHLRTAMPSLTNSPTVANTICGQTRSCLRETPLARCVRRRAFKSAQTT
jgi:hypothetical protein